MEAISAPPRSGPLALLSRTDWNAVSVWLLGFGLVTYLGLKGGGYDPLVHDQIGIGVWWIVITGLLVGVFPRNCLSLHACCALGLLAGFVVWTGISLLWTESYDKTSADLARVATYLGVFALALFIRGPKGARRMVAAVGTGIAFVAIVALLSRLHPSWFPGANQTAKFLTGSRDRLAYPINYWNGLAALIAIGAPLILQIATCAKSILARSLATATLPAMALAAFFTLSRGGMAAAIIALAIFLALTPDRLPKLLTLVVAATGSAILMASVTQRLALQTGLSNTTAHHQGNEMLVMTLTVCGGVGLIQAGVSLALTHGMRPRWSVLPRHRSAHIAVAGAILILLAAAIGNAPGRVSHAWNDFKQTGGPGSGTSRLSNFEGESRYQFWSAAAREEQSTPLTGTGSGTFEFWWNRNGDVPAVIRDTHSLYMQTFGELGLVGLLLLIAFLLTVLIKGVRATTGAARRVQPQLAAALASCSAFCVTATLDWIWHIPVLALAFLLLASVLLTTGSRPRRPSNLLMPVIFRIILVGAGLVFIAVIAIQLSLSTQVRMSQEQANATDFSAALHSARVAHTLSPDSAAPSLQQALILEQLGQLSAARIQALTASEHESTNWQPWLVLSRIEAEQGDTSMSLDAYRKARRLNLRSPLFR